MTHIYHSLRHLFQVEMHVLFWLTVAFGIIAVSLGIDLLVRQGHRPLRRWGVQIHAAAASLYGAFYLFMWYFFQVDWQYWRPGVSLWHFIVFLAGLVVVTGGYVTGLLIHHAPLHRRTRIRLLAGHMSAAGSGMVLLVLGSWPFH